MKRKKKRPAMSLSAVDTEGKFPPSFSVVEENVLAGSGIPKPELMPVQLQNLWDQKNIRAIISMTEDPLPTAIIEQKGIRYLHLPTVDLTPSTLAQLAEGVAFIDAVHAETGGGTLVHCREGVGRTGTMLAAWFVMSRRMGGQEAIEHVRSLRAGSVHQKHQELRLHQLEKICETDELRQKLIDGALDESEYDFRGLKAHTAQVMGRTTDNFLKRFYYARWLSFTAEDRGWDDTDSLHAKFLDQQRSPTWKPRLRHFAESPPAPPEPAPGGGAEPPPPAAKEPKSDDPPVFTVGGGRRRKKDPPRTSDKSEQRYYAAADAAYCSREIAPARTSLSSLGRAAEAEAGAEAATPAPEPAPEPAAAVAPEAAEQAAPAEPGSAAPATPQPPAPPTGELPQPPPSAGESVRPPLLQAARATNVAYLQDQDVPKLILRAVKAMLSDRPDSPREFLASWFASEVTKQK
eukprot:TRINITY_DN162_c1_g1_i1.p1 TRINITY_DN162_c1_g1~~TRINITY_DN162_c1_g1_i1.p1  ORF type:complete len:462 (+),score=133.05 TRINITY_DN162_c1_g1_i1:33-1418(+)